MTLTVLLLSVGVKAEGPTSVESSGIDLPDEPSRQQLFEKIKEARVLEDMQKETRLSATEFAIPKDFFFPDDARFDKIRNVARDKTLFGIDVSHYDGGMNFALLRAQKVDFVYAKATQGVGSTDDKFPYYWKGLANLKPGQRPLRGAYHFLAADGDGKKQAEHFVEYVNRFGGIGKDDMPPCLDLEWDLSKKNPDRWKGQSPDKILASAVAWLQRTKELTGRTPIVYTARSWWKDRDIPEDKFAALNEYPIWIADYSRSHKASEKPAIINNRIQSLWQFADDAKLIAGYPGRVLDASIFYGSPEDFSKEFGIGQ